jgi:cyclohexyl-isocyanide hydratase
MTETSPLTEPKPLKIGMMLYPDFTLLDLAGPQAVLGMHGQTLLLWKNLDPIMTDAGVALHPTTTFDACPDDLDILFVPGGFGTDGVMNDPEVIGFLAKAGKTAKWITSVCSGSLLLGMAGLLDGYKATTHWAFHDVLEATGATAVKQRVVHDRNRFTGGGVTSGIDFGLSLLTQLRDEQTAKVAALVIEYDPKPPFETGSPEKAGKELTDIVMGLVDNLRNSSMSIAKTRRPGASA